MQDDDKDDILLSMINSSLQTHSPKALAIAEINMYAAFNTYELYMSILKYITKSKVRIKI